MRSYPGRSLQQRRHLTGMRRPGRKADLPGSPEAARNTGDNFSMSIMVAGMVVA